MNVKISENPKVRWGEIWPDWEGILVAVELREIGLITHLQLTLTKEHGTEKSTVVFPCHDNELTMRLAVVLCGQVGNSITSIGDVEAEL
jgi:hypothetical protein